MKKQTCSEWNPKTGEVCGKAAPFKLEIDSEDQPQRITNWKCATHIRRYYHLSHNSKVRTTITAYKETTDAAKPRSPRSTRKVGSRTRRRE